jgi:hypothetical protein
MHPIAAANWSLGGSILTFAFPLVGFILAALVIYRLLWWPHRIPGHSDLVPSHTGPPDLGTAHVMAAAAGMTTAAGAGAQPLEQEPHGATEVAEPAQSAEPAQAAEPAEAGRTGGTGGPGEADGTDDAAGPAGAGPAGAGPGGTG